MISVVVTNYNESEKLKKCLQSVKDFADEIVIIDLESEEKLDNIEKEFNAKIATHKFVPYVELVRNFSISQAQNEWILILDPDEVVGDKLKYRLKEISQEGKYNAVNIPRKNVFFGKWIAHSNWWPDRHIRFFDKQYVKWSQKIHSYPEVDGKILNLPSQKELAIEHFGYSNISEFIERQNRYSTIDALNRYENGERFSFFRFIWRPLREFLVRYIKHLGFLDGKYGFSLTVLMMIYQLIVEVKLWELKKKN